MIQHILREVNTQYYMFMEDDLQLCANGLDVFKHAVDLVGTGPAVSCTRVAEAWRGLVS